MLKAFLYQINESKYQSFVEQVPNLLQSQDVEILYEKQLKLSDLPKQQVENFISQCDFSVFICIDAKYKTYFDIEADLELIASCEQPLIFITNSYILFPSGFSKIYLIELKYGEFKAVLNLIEILKKLKSHSIFIDKSILEKPYIKHKIAQEKWPLEVQQKLEEIYYLFNCLDYQKVIDKTNQILSNNSECWRAIIAKSAAFILLYRFEDAEQNLDRLIELCTSNCHALSLAYQNKAWLQCIKINKFNYDEQTIVNAINYFFMSIYYEARLVVYIDLIIILLHTNQIQKAERMFLECIKHFSNTKNFFHQQLKLRGSEFFQEIAKSSVISSLLFPRENLEIIKI